MKGRISLDFVDMTSCLHRQITVSEKFSELFSPFTLLELEGEVTKPTFTQ